MYLVTVAKEPSQEHVGVEIAGIFDSAEMANKAKGLILNWLENNGYEDAEIFVSPQEVNQLKWYELDKSMEVE